MSQITKKFHRINNNNRFMEKTMDIGDTVVRKSYDKDIIFKIIDIKEIKGKLTYIL